VCQHASNALDDVRRQEFFRAGAVMRQHGRGKRWLLLRRWKTVRGSKRAELQALFAANRRLFKAYVLREQLDRLWTYKTRPGVLNFLNGWIDALRWQRLPEMDRLGEFLFKHIEGIATAIIRSASAWSSRLTPRSKPFSVERAGCETR
jgi:transposase